MESAPVTTVVVNAPGPNSGKMATCLSQVYHEHQRGVRAGYAKFETFPIWNLPLTHPVNVAYEAGMNYYNEQKGKDVKFSGVYVGDFEAADQGKIVGSFGVFKDITGEEA